MQRIASYIFNCLVVVVVVVVVVDIISNLLLSMCFK